MNGQNGQTAAAARGAARTLEFDKITRRLSEKCRFGPGAEMALALRPIRDAGVIDLWQRETTEAAASITKNGSLPAGGAKDISGILTRAKARGLLNVAELCDVADFLYVCARVFAYGRAPAKEQAALRPHFERVTPIDALREKIVFCLISPDGVSDGASARLQSIRREIASSNAKIRDLLTSIIHSSRNKAIFSDFIITIRNGRYCLPVKQEHSRSFSGIAHEKSNAGATVFMEPLSVVAANNRVSELQSAEKEEIEKILYSLTEQVAENGLALSENVEALARLDFIFAKGELSLSLNACAPEINKNGVINILKGRHPLLEKATAVPIDIALGKDYTTLLITGPNTGGKTVALKTLGLFTLMAQAGLHISAERGSAVSVFDDVFADIGDEQSIEQSLSTFSSHMRNVVNITNAAGESSLCLLDELGAGTDPAEGAALAEAILEFLRRRGARAAVSTHYSELKLYALTTKGAVNASCEFDLKTLRPTYRLLTGVPGKSCAFEISRRLGLNETIIQNAAETLSKEAVRFEAYAADLETAKKTAERERENAERLRAAAEAEALGLAEKNRVLEARREAIISEAREKARELYEKAKNEAQELLREYKASLAGEKRAEAAEISRVLSEKGAEGAGGAAPRAREHGRRVNPNALRVGDTVAAEGISADCVVVSLPDAEGFARVLAGAIKMKIHASALYESEKRSRAAPRAPETRFLNKARSVSAEIDLRGKTAAEAVHECEKYVDDAYLAGMAQIRIIHGKGTGALRDAVWAFLKTNGRVKSFRLGAYGEGDSGVTVATIKC